MIFIPAGWFLMGTSEDEILDMKKSLGWKPEWFADETPQHRVYLDAFYIDETPVTNAEYKRFLDADPQHRAPTHWAQASRTFEARAEKHPVVYVSWDDAQDYARWAGKRLPTEAEWEKAARGPAGRRFPWGNVIDSNRCNSIEAHIGGTTPVTRYAALGDSPYRVIDMAGNVWEWCADWYAADYYQNSPTANPTGPLSSDWRVLRGGAWDLAIDYVRAASRDHIIPGEYGYALVGFRCVE
jgi:formylglycine-generating enzyme required for sulfatase activity